MARHIDFSNDSTEPSGGEASPDRLSFVAVAMSLRLSDRVRSLRMTSTSVAQGRARHDGLNRRRCSMVSAGLNRDFVDALKVSAKISLEDRILERGRHFGRGPVKTNTDKVLAKGDVLKVERNCRFCPATEPAMTVSVRARVSSTKPGFTRMPTPPAAPPRPVSSNDPRAPLRVQPT